MKKSNIILLSAIIVGCVFLLKFTLAKETNTSTISFYEVPLVCGAAPEIGCGSRLKPLFMEAAKYSEIKEAWVNRPGTVIAFVWNGENSDEKISEKLYNQYTIDAKLITEQNKINNLLLSLNGNDKWYKGMEVDQLSIEEAGVIAKTTIDAILQAQLLSEVEAKAIQLDIEQYMKVELVKVRSYDELKSEDTNREWKQNAYQIFVNHIGKERADKIAEYMGEKPCEDKSGKSGCEKDCCKKK